MGHRQSDEHWNRFKGNVGETSERRGGAHMGHRHPDEHWNRFKGNVGETSERRGGAHMGHRHPDEHWNRFKGNVGETSERRGGAYNYGLFRAHRYHLELTELNNGKGCIRVKHKSPNDN